MGCIRSFSRALGIGNEAVGLSKLTAMICLSECQTITYQYAKPNAQRNLYSGIYSTDIGRRGLTAQQPYTALPHVSLHHPSHDH